MPDIPVCATCNRPHVTHMGTPACTGHVGRCRACKERVPKTVDECPQCGSGDLDKHTPCANHPARGGPTCRFHGGNAPQVRAKAKERLEHAALERTVAQELRDLGVSVDIRDGEALIAMRAMAARKVFVYARMVDQLPADGLWHDMYHQSGIPTGEAKADIRVVLLDLERDRLAKLDETMIKLGFDQRRLRIAEAELGWLFDCVTRASAVLPEDLQESFRAALVTELRAEDTAVLAG